MHENLYVWIKYLTVKNFGYATMCNSSGYTLIDVRACYTW